MEPNGPDRDRAPRLGTVTVFRCEAAGVPEEGRARGYAEQRIFVVRHRGQLHAWRDACPHHGDTPLAWRRHAYLNADASRIVCAAHGAQFDPATGECLLGPCLGQSLTRVPLVVASGGGIAIEPTPFQETPS